MTSYVITTKGLLVAARANRLHSSIRRPSLSAVTLRRIKINASGRPFSEEQALRWMAGAEVQDPKRYLARFITAGYVALAD